MYSNIILVGPTITSRSSNCGRAASHAMHDAMHMHRRMGSCRYGIVLARARTYYSNTTAVQRRCTAVQCSRILARIHACVRCGDADRVPAVDSTYSIHVPVGTSRSIRIPVVDLVVSTTVYACARVRSPMPFIIAMHDCMHRIASHVVVHVRRRRPAAGGGGGGHNQRQCGCAAPVCDTPPLLLDGALGLPQTAGSLGSTW